MVDEPSQLHGSDEEHVESSSKGPDLDTRELQETVAKASEERKSLQLLAEFFQNNVSSLEEKKRFFESVFEKIPEIFQKLDSLNRQTEDFKALEVQTQDLQSVI